MKINRYDVEDGIVKAVFITDLKRDLKMARFEMERPHGKCNQCRYYEGVHCVQGHAPCSFWKIGGVLWNDFCSRFEKEGEAE